MSMPGASHLAYNLWAPNNFASPLQLEVWPKKTRRDKRCKLYTIFSSPGLNQKIRVIQSKGSVTVFISESWSVVTQPLKESHPTTIYLFHKSVIYTWHYSTIQPIFLAKSSDKNKLVGGWTKNISQIGNLSPIFGLKIPKKNIWSCHHL